MPLPLFGSTLADVLPCHCKSNLDFSVSPAGTINGIVFERLIGEQSKCEWCQFSLTIILCNI